MDEHTYIDYLIVGQGLAGSALALGLLKRKKKILVIDDRNRNAASRVAAGLFNPITGKNNTKTWMADELFPYLHRFYREAESLTGGNFLFSMPIYRPFTSIHEQNEWMGKSADSTFLQFIETIQSTPMPGNAVNDFAGGLLLKQTGYLDTSSYLGAVRAHLQTTGSFFEGHFEEEMLLSGANFVSYFKWRARKVILCQGTASTRNIWFGDLPISPLKGETLTIKTEWNKHVILNRGVYMVPGKEPGEFKVGATYRTDDITPGITERSRLELVTKLDDLLTVPFTVVDQSWGFRPTTPDRKPILGPHKKNGLIIIFNGLGTKGVSLAPYFSEVLIRWLENNETLNKHVSVTRYY